MAVGEITSGERSSCFSNLFATEKAQNIGFAFLLAPLFLAGAGFIAHAALSNKLTQRASLILLGTSGGVCAVYLAGIGVFVAKIHLTKPK